jgi:hypothetical protein
VIFDSLGIPRRVAQIEADVVEPRR